MNYRIIILIAISAIIIYFSIAELVWQLRNRRFRRRLVIGVIITALAVSHIDFINLFTKTDAEVVSAAAAGAETDTESVKVSAIKKLSDRIKGHAAAAGTEDERIDSDEWQVVRISADMNTETAGEAEVDEKLLFEEISGDTEGEILTETEEGTEEENSTETERNTEEDSSAEIEKDTEEENSSESGKDTEENPAEEEKGTEDESSTEQESSAEGILEENSMEDSAESEQSADEAESAADVSTVKESKIQEETDSANETYTITYKPGKYGNGTVMQQTKTYGRSIDLSKETFTRTGYTQTGWAVSDGGALKYELGETYEKDADITLYPVWTADTYEITYEPGQRKDVSGEVAKQTKIYGKTLILSTGKFTRQGYEQTGWAISEDGVKAYDLGGKYTENKAITLYPVWADVYTITYEPGDNCTGKSATQTKIQGKSISLYTARFTRKDYKQIGWSREYNVKNIDYELGGSYKEDSDITLYPVWAKAYKVTYHKDGGTINHEDDYTSYAYGVGLELPEPTKSGYVFMGWYKDPDFNGSAVSSISKTSKENKTFYAKWEEIGTEEYDYYEDSYDGSASSDNGDTYSGNIVNTQLGTDEQTESGADGIDEINEDMKGEPSPENTGNSKGKRKEKEIKEIGDGDTDDTDSSDGQTESDADDEMESSEEPEKSMGETEVKSANRSVQARLENGEIVIDGNTDGSNGAGVSGSGTEGESSRGESANEPIGTGTIPGEESATTVLVVGEGTVTVAVVSDGWKYGVGVADTVAAANILLTSEQKQLANSGENIEVRLVAKDISGQVSGEDRSVIEDGLEADSEEKSGKLIPAAYIDISIDIRTGDEEWKAVTRTEQPIKLVVGVSEEMSNGGTFYIARSHESKYALLDDMDSESDTVTVMTDFFSTYAIVYQQMPATASEISINTERIYDYFASHPRTTAAWIGAALLYIGIMEILGIIVILILGRQYKKEKEDVRREMVNP